MTRDEIDRRLASIRDNAADYERAHSEEDDLYRDFLIALQNGLVPTEDISALVGLLLTSTEIDFARHCA